MVPDLVGIKAQHVLQSCLQIITVNELNGYQGFTKEVLFFFKNNYTNFKSLSHPSSRYKQNVVVLPSNENFCVINMTEELTKKV